MNNLFKKLIIIPVILLIYSCQAPTGNENTSVLIKTTLGDIKIKLYDATPVHRDNFIYLVKEGIYENVIFHRIIKDFMIQAGDLSTRPVSVQNFSGFFKYLYNTFRIQFLLLS